MAKLGFNQATTLKNSTLVKDLVLAEKYGYDYIEIRLDKLKEFFRDHTVDELAAFFAGSRLKPYSFNALEFITFRDKAGYAAIKEDLGFLCKVGQRIGCREIVVVPTFDVGDKTLAEIRRESHRALGDLADEAVKYGVRLAYEFVGYPNCSVNTFGQCYEIVASLNRADVGMVLDCFHFHAMNSRLDDLRQADAAKLFILHIDDSEDLPPGWLRDHHRLWPGDGVAPLADILGTLKRKGFDNMISVELFRPEYWGWDAEAAFRAGKEKTEAVLATYFR